MMSFGIPLDTGLHQEIRFTLLAQHHFVGSKDSCVLV